MKKKSDTPALILALLVTLGLLAGGAWLLARQFAGVGNSPQPRPADTTTTTTATTTTATGSESAAFSDGGSSLIPSLSTPEKQSAFTAFAAGNYAEAEQQFAASLQGKRNDPEAVIFKNNAIAAQLDSSLVIGASLPITSNENAALEMMRGIAQAQDEINRAGGINGRPLFVLLADDRNTEATARQVAQGFAKNKSVVGVIGPYASGVSLATLEPYEAGKLTHISPVSTSIELSNASPYFFRTVPSDYIAARALAEHAVSQLDRRNALVYFNSQSAYSQSLKGEFTTALSLGGGQVVAEVDLSESRFSAQQSLQSAQQQGTDVIVLLPDSGTLNQTLQVVSVNQNQLPIIAGDDVYAPTTLEVSGATGEGMLIAIPWHIEASPDPSFADRSRDLWFATVNWRTALSYDAVQAIAQALRSNPSREGVQTALSSSGFQADGASGEIRFLPSGDRNAGVQLVEIQPGEGPGGFRFAPRF